MPVFSPELLNELVQRELTKEKQQAFMRPEAPKPSIPATPLSPKAALILGGLTDVGGTYIALKHQGARETNPAFQFFNKHPWSIAPTAAAVGLGYAGLHKLLKKVNPKFADKAAGLLGGYQMALGASNVEDEPVNSMQSVAEDFRPKKR